MVARDHRKHDGKVILQVADGPRLVGSHQGAIANNVGRKNCRQSADDSRIFAGLRHCQASHSAPLGLPSTSPITLCLTFGLDRLGENGSGLRKKWPEAAKWESRAGTRVGRSPGIDGAADTGYGLSSPHAKLHLTPADVG